MSESQLNEMDMGSILETMKDQPFYKQAEAKKKQEILDKRIRAVAELERVNADGLKIIERIQSDLEIAKTELSETEAMLKTRSESVARLSYELFQEKTRMENEKGKQKTILLDNYDPKIDEAIQYFQDLFYSLQNPKHFQKYGTEGKFSILHLKRLPGEVESNHAVIKRTLEYCRESMQELEAMKLLPEPDFERIEALKKGVPDWENTFEAHHIPRPFSDLPEGIKFLPPRTPSTKEKLFKKCADLLNI